MSAASTEHGLRAPHRIVVGLSGGVDSAVAALLLKRRGLDVQAVFMKNWEEDDRAGFCAAAQDIDDARAVCEAAGIPLYLVNLSSEYWERVFSRFLREYRSGRTPNPDVLCNKEIKFRAFLDYAHTLGAGMTATGHYARILRHDSGAFRLLRGQDAGKDQSYFLHALDQRQLARAVFPVGELTKSAVREIARAAGLRVHDKKDSTGICFIGEQPFREFLGRFLPPSPGPIETPEGKRLGTHHGLAFYTLGQRSGLGIGGRKGSAGEPWYVAAKDRSHNTLIVVQGHDHPLLFSTSLMAREVNWVAGSPPRMPLHCTAKVRYRQADQECVVTGGKRDLQVEFAQPQRAVTPGQSVVLYRGLECLGGGVIHGKASEDGRSP